MGTLSQDLTHIIHANVNMPGILNDSHHISDIPFVRSYPHGVSVPGGNLQQQLTYTQSKADTQTHALLSDIAAPQQQVSLAAIAKLQTDTQICISTKLDDSQPQPIQQVDIQYGDSHISYDIDITAGTTKKGKNAIPEDHHTDSILNAANAQVQINSISFSMASSDDNPDSEKNAISVRRPVTPEYLSNSDVPQPSAILPQTDTLTCSSTRLEVSTDMQNPVDNSLHNADTTKAPHVISPLGHNSEDKQPGSSLGQNSKDKVAAKATTFEPNSEASNPLPPKVSQQNPEWSAMLIEKTKTVKVPKKALTFKHASVPQQRHTRSGGPPPS